MMNYQVHSHKNGKSDGMEVFFASQFKNICLVSGSLPLFALVTCFVTAYIFQYDEVHETFCRVYNVIPSISAVTGVSPQRYIWRICIALHIGPRVIIGSVYYYYHKSLYNSANNELLTTAKRWANITYWLHLIEIAAFCGVTYISNVENYPMHERIFIVFLISSLTHMMTNIKLLEVTQKITPLEKVRRVLAFKKAMFYVSVAAIVGLIVFFLKHRLFCHDLAFTWFAFCEYIIAIANLLFHMMVVFDFPDEQLIVANDKNGGFIPRLKID